MEEEKDYDDSWARNFLRSSDILACVVFGCVLIAAPGKFAETLPLFISTCFIIFVSLRKPSASDVDLSWDVPRLHLVGIIALNILAVGLMWLFLHDRPFFRPHLPLASFCSPYLTILMLMPYRNKK